MSAAKAHCKMDCIVLCQSIDVVRHDPRYQVAVTHWRNNEIANQGLCSQSEAGSSRIFSRAPRT